MASPSSSADEQRQLALEVVTRLREAGYQALWAGGCVRDKLLGRVPNDYDVATNATPPDIRKVFGRRHTLEIGVAFGVVAVLGRHRSVMVEVSTFRRDAEYSDGRHPDAVVFSTPEEDAQRRDFTINGLFYDPLADKIIDYVGGVDDLNRCVVRAIGDPRARFSEDKLRMIRAVRITAGFDFALDSATEAAVEEMAPTIGVVSPERIAQEMRKILTAPRRAAALELLHRAGLFAVLLPEMAPVFFPAGAADASPAWQITARTLTALAEPELALVLAALACGTFEPAGQETSAVRAAANERAASLAGAICHRWRLSNKELDRATWLASQHGRLAQAAEQAWSAVQPLLVAPGAADLVALWEADRAARAPAAAAEGLVDVAFCRAKIALPAGELNPPPLVSGDDLAAIGIAQGPIYRQLLQRVRAAQLDGSIRTAAEGLDAARRLADELSGNAPSE